VTARKKKYFKKTRARAKATWTVVRGVLWSAWFVGFFFLVTLCAVPISKFLPESRPRARY